MIIGTAGHVDHGKTALIKALTGVETDRLAEERRRGITIDLGYAYTEQFGFIDVPGHERFVHTMLAGASGIDTALLVVALPEGVRPQTREHLAILSLLGVTRGVVALTKLDIAADRIAPVTAELTELLAGTNLQGAAMVPVSAVTGQGIDTLRKALLSAAPAAKRPTGYPRLAVDRAFTLTGTGLVVTGTLVSGRIEVDDRLMLSPPGLDLRVRGLHAQNQPAQAAVAGQRVALNITGPRLSKESVERGHWVLHPDLHAPIDRLDAWITLLADAPRPLRPDTQVHLHLGAAHVMARVSLLDTDRLEPGNAALARLTLQQAIGALARDRIVLRDPAATHTIGGGIVLDPFAPKRGRRTATRLAQLAGLQAGETAATAISGLLACPPGWADQRQLFLAQNLPPAEQTAIPALSVGGLLFSPAAWTALRGTIRATLEETHRTAPEQPGLQAERLRQTLSDRPPAANFNGLLDVLVRDGSIARDGPWFRLPSHRIILSPQDEKLWRAARPLIEADRFRPPRTRDLAQTLNVPENTLRGTLKRLQRIGQIIEIAPDHFFPRETVAEMVAIAADTADADGGLTAAAFRDRLDNGRKVAIQILEFFDRAGVTLRSGDLRRVRADRRTLFGPPHPLPPSGEPAAS